MRNYVFRRPTFYIYDAERLTERMLVKLTPPTPDSRTLCLAAISRISIPLGGRTYGVPINYRTDIV